MSFVLFVDGNKTLQLCQQFWPRRPLALTTDTERTYAQLSPPKKAKGTSRRCVTSKLGRHPPYHHNPLAAGKRMVGAAVFLRLSSVEPIFQLAVLAAKLVDFLLKFLALFHRPCVHGPPVADLLPQVDDLTSQFRNLLP